VSETVIGWPEFEISAERCTKNPQEAGRISKEDFCILVTEKTVKQPARRYYRKRVEIFRLIEKIKLWPSRRGLLHGIKSIDIMGDQARITTHCNKAFLITISRNSRAARWLRNKWFQGTCGVCRVPDWKLAKYSSTHFKRHYGSALSQGSEEGN
jgi:pyrrolysyl-tRNA synthetase-like protein